MSNDITERPAIRTKYAPREFIAAMQSADSPEREAAIREQFRKLDSGRFYDFLDEAHNVLAKSDLDRREHFTAQYSEHLILWIKAFGHVEHLSTFPRIDVE